MVEESINRAEKRAKAIDLMGEVCSKCGTVENLEFDHINADRKGDKNLLSQLWASKWDRILTELEKCQLLCKSCHSLKSIYDAGLEPAEHGSNSMYRKRCRCDDCRIAHTAYNRRYPDKRRLKI